MSRHAWRRWAETARESLSRCLLLDPRRRNHLAMLAAALTVTVLGYVVLQPRRVVVQADGRQVVVSTRLAQDGAVLRRSGVDLAPGDRVTSLSAPDAEVLRVERASVVSLHVDGADYQLLTHAETIDQLLAEADVALGDRDSVLQDGEFVSPAAPVEPPRLFASAGPLAIEASPGRAIDIAVRRAVPFSITENGRTVDSSSSRQTVIQALREAGVVVGPGDLVQPDQLDALAAGTDIRVQHAKAVTITLPDEHRVVYTLAATVGDALSDAGVTLPEGAFTIPSTDTPVTAGMSVSVVQLSAGSDVEREYIASNTVYKPDPSLTPGETRTVQGHDGVHVRQYEISYVNGEEAGRTLVDDYYDPEPQDTVVYYPVQKAKDTPPALVAGKTLHVYATWYDPASSGRAPSDPAYGRTATGVVVTYGIVAVDPDVIPLGTKMFIPGYGYAVAADTGGAVKGYIIDLGYPDGVQVDWQSKWVDITILS
ncbi:MAG TPA: ubiquitin-like domain-containing protein [Dehalococcoidia bacterium]|nr:ubiquitin-like domain-containing protein [Dehalococcoidia bacterium]